ncbi:hypothetical protein PRZ48_007620 [Zasmidium cellare]|uniref:Uncharacterized protein n=1 Tax=Zasmidium cellare TaxID=395010 RepID=A0ABR0EJU7_ZASCE|nr:hypothetical protein PRZ48_007620 [Zasmidium cellare]
MPAKWDDLSEKQMLLALIHLSPPTGAIWSKAASMLGEDYTGEAVRQKYMKMKKAAGAQWGEVEIGKGETPVKKGGKKAAGENKSTGKRKSKKDVEDAEGDDAEESPSKKVKAENEKSGGSDEEV